MNQKIIFIGLIEEGNNRNLFKITDELFKLSGYDIIYNSENNAFGYSNSNSILIIIDLIAESLSNESISYFNFDIVVYSSIDNHYLNNIINLLKKSKVCIYNSDGEGMIPLLTDLEDCIAINYGFNNKSTLTISSYNTNEFIEANLCLQRGISPYLGDGDIIEPFEFVLEINSCDEKIIYPVLAAASLNLLLGDSILNKKSYTKIRI